MLAEGGKGFLINSPEYEQMYYPPVFQGKAFTCPFCNVYSRFTWVTIGANQVGHFLVGHCTHCSRKTYWKWSTFPDSEQREMLYPLDSNLPMPHEDMPGDIHALYNEARATYPHSVRASAALLRLCLQKLCIHLGKNKNINKAIAELVEDGLPQEVQMALDAVRIIGNESVHPGEIQDAELTQGVAKSFELLNFIVQDRISRFNQIAELYASLPEAKLSEIDRRDSKEE